MCQVNLSEEEIGKSGTLENIAVYSSVSTSSYMYAYVYNEVNTTDYDKEVKSKIMDEQ